jgi:hypothetical protein
VIPPGAERLIYFRPYTARSTPPAPEAKTSIESFKPGKGYQPASFSLQSIQDEGVEGAGGRISSYVVVQVRIDQVDGQLRGTGPDERINPHRRELGYGEDGDFVATGDQGSRSGRRGKDQ